MGVKLSPIFQPDGTVSDANGAPRSGAKLFVYNAGTTTKVTAYQESTGTTAHTNPILLNANGLPPAPIWLTESSNYKFVLAPSTDTDPPVSAILTIDSVSAVNDVAAPAAGTEWTASGMTPTQTGATTFTVSGDQTTVLHVGRRLKTTNTGGTVYCTIIRSVYTSLTTVTVLADSGSLDSGLSAFSYGIASADNTSLPFISRDQQCGRLIYVSATQIRLDPQDGNTIWVYSGSNWRLRTIPSAGITAANSSIYIDGTSGQNLAANTAYYVYLFDNAGVLTMDFSTTAPAVDAASGLKIKTGVATRLLIGMVRTQGSTPGQFQTPALVLSWYKRRAIKASAAFSTSQTTGSATIVEVATEIRVSFLTWSEEDFMAMFAGRVANNGTTGTNTTHICLDGTSTILGLTASADGAANFGQNASLTAMGSASEGYHYATIGGMTSAGTASWAGGGGHGTLFVRTQG